MDRGNITQVDEGFMKKIAVYCGSSSGTEAIYKEQANALGEAMAKRHIGLVYGGAKVGLMGAIADAVLKAGQEVIGVLPTFFGTKEIAHEDLTELIMVKTMHERKMKMNELCDGVIAMPGGFGTMEELFEMLTWGQIGLHSKPVAILNTNGYYDSLIALADQMVSDGFLKKLNQELLIVENDVEVLLDKMENYEVTNVPKWIIEKKAARSD